MKTILSAKTQVVLFVAIISCSHNVFAEQLVNPKSKHYCQYAYVNHNATNDISSFGINMQTGELEPLGLPMLATGNYPGSFYTHPNGNFLYVLAGEGNNVTVYKINHETGQLTTIQTIDTAGSGPWAGVITPKTGEFLYVNNNKSNNIVMFKVDYNTGLLSLNKTALHPDALIENAPNAVGPDSIKITSNKKYVYVSNYNSNNITIYHYNESNGDLTLAQSKAISAGGMQPRQLALSPAAVPSDPTYIPQNKRLYVLNQLSNSITQFDLDENGLIIPNAHPPTVSTGGYGPTSISIEGNYRYIYAPNMSSNTVASFEMDQINGLLTPLNPPTVKGGIQGKGIFTNLGYTYVTNFADNTVSQFKQDANGVLSKIGHDIQTGGVNPGNITFTPFPKGCQ